MRIHLRRLVHAFANHGFGGVIARGFHKILRRPQSPDPLAAAVTDEAQHPFDLAHHVDTSGYIPGEQLASGLGVPASEFYNTAYYAISPSTLRHALKLLPEPSDAFTFVDLGCGKGRALLVAAELPFARILGIELSPELSAIAQSNTAADQRIAIHHADAATFIYPDTPLVVFLYHPFLRHLLRRTLLNLERQLRRSPRPVYLLYANPGYQATVAQFRWLQEVWDFSIPLSAEDLRADRHGITHERFTLYRGTETRTRSPILTREETTTHD
jgi:SAM-dependent methyltransferase